MDTAHLEADVVADAMVADWRDDAICKGKTHLFFPPNAERPQARARREAVAKRLCDSCPVAYECRHHARTNHEYGYWAGESEEDRHLLGYRVSAPIGIRSRLARGITPQTQSA
jgi:WhiB family transcriptional regulator, redox-sensing transcriptional regulator